MPKRKPSRVILHFVNREQRDYFMGQLSDGWGENYVNLKRRGKTHEYDVDPTVDGVWEHHQDMKRLYGDQE